VHTFRHNTKHNVTDGQTDKQKCSPHHTDSVIKTGQNILLPTPGECIENILWFIGETAWRYKSRAWPM